jgi:DNA-binding Xre family transcriptional regulator
MAERSVEVLATFTDKYGDERKIRRVRRNRVQVMQTTNTVCLRMNEVVVKRIGSRIRELRKARGMTLADLARRAGLAGNGDGALKQRMFEIENSLSGGARLGTLYSIALALEVPIGDLLPTTEDALADANIKEQSVMVAG